MRLSAFRSIGGALVLAGLVAQSSAVAATVDLVVVSVDKARVARIPDKTQTLVIGQPGIADVTMLKNSGMGVITGKSFGETNLIALDGQGNLLGEWTIRVGGDNAGPARAERRQSRELYLRATLPADHRSGRRQDGRGGPRGRGGGPYQFFRW